MYVNGGLVSLSRIFTGISRSLHKLAWSLHDAAETTEVLVLSPHRPFRKLLPLHPRLLGVQHLPVHYGRDDGLAVELRVLRVAPGRGHRGVHPLHRLHCTVDLHLDLNLANSGLNSNVP